MSADLFAEFGSTRNARDAVTKGSTFDGPANDFDIPDGSQDAEEFGDFETPEQSDHDASAHVGHVAGFSKDPDHIPPQEQKSGRPSSYILFDATDPVELSHGNSTNESGQPDVRHGLADPSHFQSNTPSDLIDFGDTFSQTPHKVTSVKRVLPTVSSEQVEYGRVSDDDWPDLENVPAVPKDKAQQANQIALPSSVTDYEATLVHDPQSLQPPQSVPPPSVILTLFPPIFTQVSEVFLQPVSALASEARAKMLMHTRSRSILIGYHGITTVFAHVLAGRRLRWKRDKLLAQSMSIGPSVSGRSGGMKLIGLDKNESSREDREALDVVNSWKAQLGRLRTVVTAANAPAALSTLPTIPLVTELSSNMPVRTAKMAEGAVVSLHACSLCGLKREERVAKIDDSVQDSFGEWWLDNPRMHVSCWKFWEAQKDSLRSR